MHKDAAKEGSGEVGLWGSDAQPWGSSLPSLHLALIVPANSTPKSAHDDAHQQLSPGDFCYQPHPHTEMTILAPV